MKLPSTGIVKYHVKLKFEVDGLVEKADIIGAIFGQTEGLLGPEMNLNELQLFWPRRVCTSRRRNTAGRKQV